MKGFNLQPSTGKTCANCAMSKNHLANGLICLYTDKPASTGIAYTTISRMLQAGYQPFKTEARYFSETQRGAEWFSQI